MAQGLSKENPNQRYHSGKRKEVKVKHIRKEGLTGLGNLKRRRTQYLVIRTPAPKRMKLQSRGQLCGLSPASGLGELDPVRTMGPPDSRSKKWVV